MMLMASALAAKVKANATAQKAHLGFVLVDLIQVDLDPGKLHLFGLARKMWRAPTEEPGGVLWETGTDRRRSFGVKRCGLH